jgi:hypothetical protein
MVLVLILCLKNIILKSNTFLLTMGIFLEKPHGKAWIVVNLFKHSRSTMYFIGRIVHGPSVLSYYQFNISNLLCILVHYLYNMSHYICIYSPIFVGGWIWWLIYTRHGKKYIMMKLVWHLSLHLIKCLKFFVNKCFTCFFSYFIWWRCNNVITKIVL